ncbi:hypothetical protein Tco_0003141 [Tanacetum coccineum]
MEEWRVVVHFPSSYNPCVTILVLIGSKNKEAGGVCLRFVSRTERRERLRRMGVNKSVKCVGTPAGRVILFGTIPTTIPEIQPVIDSSLPTQTDNQYHSSPDLPSTSAGLSRKRRRSPMTYVPALPLVSGALSPVHADLIPSPKRFRDSGYSTDVEVDPRETSLRDGCYYALRDRGIEARVVVEAVDRDETETGVEGPVEVRVERVTILLLPAVIALTERIAELERDNRRLRGTASVESQRVDRLQRGMSRMQRELRQMRRLRFYDRVRVGRLERCARKHMGYRP